MVPKEIDGVPKPEYKSGDWNIQTNHRPDAMLGCWVSADVAVWYLQYYRQRYPQFTFNLIRR